MNNAPEQATSRLKHLEDLIETYATSSMTFETFLQLALGDERAARVMERSDAQAEALMQWSAGGR